MNNKDYFVPLCDFEELIESPAFAFVVPLDDDLAESTVSTLVTIHAVDDDIFFQSDEEPTLEDSMDRHFFDILYIRETRLRGVIPAEWDECYGPQDPNEFFEDHPDHTMESPVKVLCLKAVNYDLKTLRKNHRSQQRPYKGGDRR